MLDIKKNLNRNTHKLFDFSYLSNLKQLPKIQIIKD